MRSFILLSKRDRGLIRWISKHTQPSSALIDDFLSPSVDSILQLEKDIELRLS